MTRNTCFLSAPSQRSQIAQAAGEELLEGGGRREGRGGREGEEIEG